MSNHSPAVIDHYARERLGEKILAALEGSGKDINNLTLADLAPVEEFHTLGRAATKELAEKLELSAVAQVLDVGSGIGGPARYLAHTYGCHVTGIDVTPAYVEVATMLSERVGLSEKTAFVVGDGAHLPFDDNTFDVVLTQHTSMNIEDKDAFYTGLNRVMTADGTLALFDIMAGEREPHFPVPWADTANESFLIAPEEVRAKLESAGFAIGSWEDKTDAALAWFQDITAKAQAEGPPPVGLHLVLGPDAPTMFANYGKNLAEGRIRVIQVIARAAE